MDIECWQDEHKFFAFVFALPALTLFGILSPGFIMIYLLK